MPMNREDLIATVKGLKDGLTVYPDCRGLIVMIPAGLDLILPMFTETIAALNSEGKVVQYIGPRDGLEYIAEPTLPKRAA